MATVPKKSVTELSKRPISWSALFYTSGLVVCLKSQAPEKYNHVTGNSFMNFSKRIVRAAYSLSVALLTVPIANQALSETLAAPTTQDLVALHYDVSPDLDDLQAIAAGANLSEWANIFPAVVIGTYGRVNHSQFGNLEVLYNVDTNTFGQGPNTGETRRQKAQAVANAAFGSGNYLDTGVGWTQTVNAQAAIFWPVLNNGKTVFVADGGPMDFTADVLTRLQTYHSATAAQLKQVRVVQHSLGFNVQQTMPANLTKVQNLATYITIDNGNVGNNTTADLEDRNTNTTTSAFAQWARNENAQSQAWNAALDRFSAITDFSDTVEYLYILDISLASISNLLTFTTYCDRQNCAMAVPPECNGHTVTVNIGSGQLPTSGDDVILGTRSSDNIDALQGNDIICALEGDDIINAGAGSDWVDAGPGNDVVDGGTDSDILFGDSGTDILTGGPGNDEIYGEDDGDFINGNSGDDILNGDNGVDQILGGSGDDTIHTGNGGNIGSGLLVDGGSGNDTITGGSGDDEIRAATGNDIIHGSTGNDALYGGGGNDTINGQNGDDLIRGNGSNDTITGGNGNDDIDGGSGDDTIYGGNDDDTVSGSTGDDQLSGGAGRDTLDGGGGNDILFGNRGDDLLFGGGNNDHLIGGSNNDTCDGENGTDTTATCETVTNSL